MFSYVKGLQTSRRSKFLVPFFLQSYVMNPSSLGVSCSILTCSLAGLWPTDTYGASLESSNIYILIDIKGVLGVLGSLKTP